MSALDIAPPRYEIGPFDRIVLPDARSYTSPRRVPDGYILVEEGTDLAQTVDFATFEKLRNDPAFRHDRDYHDLGHAEARARSGVDSLFDLPRDEMIWVLYKEAWALALEDAYAAGETKLVDPEIASILPTLKERVYRQQIFEKAPTLLTEIDGALAKKGHNPKKKYFQTTIEGFVPKLRTLREWHHVYITCGFVATALRDRYRFCGNHLRRKHPDVLDLMYKYVRSYLSQKRPTQKQCYKAFCRALKTSGIKLRRGDRSDALTVSSTTFFAAIRAIPKFERRVGRYGLPAALRRFKMVSRSFGATRIGELVQMDEWRVSAVTLYTESGLWKHMSPAQRKAVERQRLWLSVIIDVASRYTLAMRLSETLPTEASLLTLRMMFQDKSALARAAGCRSPWSGFTKPTSLRHDTGSHLTANRFRLAVADLRIIDVCPPAGIPELRPHIERLFGSMRTDLLGYVSGQTFANVIDKGDYDPGEVANLTQEQLRELLVLWVVDVYHNSPHEGLRGQTPARRWQELERAYGRGAPPPSAHELRAACGVTIERKLNNHGVRVLGLHYVSPALGQHFLDHAEIDVDVRVDQHDLGWVSVRIDGRWEHARCRTSGFRGVGIETWMRTLRDVRRRYQDEAKDDQAIADEALDLIQRRTNDADDVAGLTGIIADAEFIARAERDYVRTLAVVADEDAPKPDDLLSGGVTVQGPDAAPSCDEPPLDLDPEADEAEESSPPASAWPVHRP